MQNELTIYHNPRCSKSRQTLALLEAHGYQPTIVEYLNNPPDASTLRDILHKLGVTPRDIMRSKEAAYQQQQLDEPSLSDEALIQAIADTPILLERPIVVNGEQAAIGRPPANVLEIL